MWLDSLLNNWNVVDLALPCLSSLNLLKILTCLMPLIYGPLYLVYLVFPGLCLNKWLSFLLVGIEVLGNIGWHVFGV